MLKHFLLLLVLGVILVLPAAMIISGWYGHQLDPQHIRDILGGQLIFRPDYQFPPIVELLVGIPLVLVAGLMSLVCGYVLGRYEFPGRLVIFWGILIACLLDGAVDVPLRLVFIYDSSVWFHQASACMQFVAAWTFILALCIGDLPRSLIELAKLDGMSPPVDFACVIWPRMRTVIAVMVVAMVCQVMLSAAWPRLELAINGVLGVAAFVSVQRCGDGPADQGCRTCAR